MGVMNRILNYLGLQEEEETDRASWPSERHGYQEQDEPEGAAVETRRVRGKNNVVSIHAQKTARVVLTEPRSYDEAQEIADHLKFRRSVVVNLQRIRRDHAMRIVDFLSGTVYALGGHIAKIGPDIFLCTPDSVEVTGTITEMLSEEDDYPKMR